MTWRAVLTAWLLLCLAVRPVFAEEPAPRVLTLRDVLRTARAHQPQLRQAYAQTQAAYARADQARAPLLPQLSGAATYERTTGNFAPRPGAFPRAGATGTTAPSPSFRTFDYWTFGATASILLFDFGQTPGRWQAARASAVAQRQSEALAVLQVVLGARAAFLNAHAARALLAVARDQLLNQTRHLRQIEGFVTAGTRPEIDLAQARVDVANARVQVINAENGYAVARAQLNQAMGVEGSIDYDVADDTLLPVRGEDASTDVLAGQAIRERPDLRSLDAQIRSQQLTVRALRGGYWPALTASTGVTDNGTQLDHLVWNWNATVSLTWELYQGGVTLAQVDEANATLAALRAQRDTARQQLRVQVEQARLAVQAAKAVRTAAEDALVNARDQLRLAEGRYAVGLGSAIELGDAQVALTSASVQRVQAEYNLGAARAQLLEALGRQ